MITGMSLHHHREASLMSTLLAGPADPPAPADPATLAVLLDQLEPEAIIQQLLDLDAQSSALRVLLRAARARQRRRKEARRAS
jgi:hypothetical protein